jgi:hypothetical protein
MKNQDDHSWFNGRSSSGNTNSDKASAALSPPYYRQGTARSGWSNRFIIAAIVQGAVINWAHASLCRRANADFWNQYHRVPLTVV